MSKRDYSDIESETDALTNDYSTSLRKKIKIEHDYIVERAKKVKEGIDLTEHKVNKFLLIFHTLLETLNLEREPEETDSIITDIILQIVLKLSSLIRQDIDTLKIPNVLKEALKVIKQLFQNAKTSSSSSRAAMEETIKEPPSSPSSSSSSSSFSTSIPQQQREQDQYTPETDKREHNHQYTLD